MMTYYDGIFLERFNRNLRLDKWADHKNIPLARGQTANYFAYYPLSGTSTAITEGRSSMNEATIRGQTVEATVKKYAQWVGYTERFKLTARDENLAKQAGLFGDAAAESLEEVLATELFQNGSIPIRTSQLSNSASYTHEGTVDTSAGNSSTFFYDDAIVHTTDLFAGAHMAVTSGATRNYRYGGIVSVHGSTAEGFTMATAAPNSFSSGTTYRMVVGTGIGAAQPLTASSIRYAVSKARANKFFKFPGGWFRSTLAAETEYDLQGSTIWQNMSIYQDKSMVEKGVLRHLWGVEFYFATLPYREDVDGTKNLSAGVVFCTPIMGPHALGNVSLAGMKGHKILFKTPGLQTISEPYDENGTIGYKFYAAAKSLNAAFCINIMSGATGVA
jgi:hypothetical protein